MSRFSMLAGFAVGVSLLVTPVAAQAGWGDGRGRHHRDGGVDAGDVIAGVLVLGAIAAIVGFGNRNSRDDERRREQRYPEPDYRNREETRPVDRANYQSSRGIDSAVSMCVDQVERGDARVDSVDNAARTSDGWRVSGVLDSGSGWNCWIDNDGRIREVDLAGIGAESDGGYATATAATGDRQLSDEAYARARAAQGTASTAAPADGPQPAYPGGPLPGEEGYDEAVELSRAN